MNRFLFLSIVCLVATLAACRSLEAQDDPPDQPSNQPAVADSSNNTSSAEGKFPPNPGGFHRGNPSVPGKVPVVGYYLSMWCFAFVLGMFFLWNWTAQWVYSDSRVLKVDPEFWSSVLLGGGAVGFLAAVCIPQFFVGYFLLLLGYGIPVGFYVQKRNTRVPEAGKVLTPNAIRNTIIRRLAQIGIHIGSQSSQDAAIGSPITFIGKTTTSRGDDVNRSRQVESSAGFLAAKELIYDAILRRSTDVHLEPKQDEIAVRLRIDGVMYPTEPFARGVGESVLNIFKVLGAMDITEKRRPQDGSFRAEMEDRDIDFRLATQGTRYGEKLSLRILDQSVALGSLARLGLRKQLQERLRVAINQPHGMVLVCGPTGAGKSTTLYAALSELDAYQRNIITVEDPIEYKMENVNQIEINTKAGQTFASSLRSILRQDPDVVMIGEIRDAETAEIACQAANTGHIVFTTVHANDTITALYRMLELGVEPFMVANSISLILGQRLVRRLCNDCREPYKANPDFLKKVGLPPEKIQQFYRPPKDPEEACAACGGLGFRGRIGVYEMLEINERIRDLIREKAPLSAVRAEARKNGMLYMKEEALRLLARGMTSINELQKVVK